jgi:hypothetical protein
LKISNEKLVISLAVERHQNLIANIEPAVYVLARAALTAVYTAARAAFTVAVGAGKAAVNAYLAKPPAVFFSEICR